MNNLAWEKNIQIPITSEWPEFPGWSKPANNFKENALKISDKTNRCRTNRTVST